MPFQPEVDQALEIDGVAYRVAAHPASPSMVYGQEGRQGTVYQLISTADRRAMKVFKPRHRVPAMVTLADHLAVFADMPGLAVCQRVVLSARRHTELLRQYPDLTYAVLMPWIAGPTWFEVIVEKRELAAEQCLGLARSFLGVLTAMEERGVAHCDLSGPNVVLPVFAEPATADSRADVALVDVEGLFGPGLERPEVVLGGSSGYAQRFTTADVWDAKADRFTGALLLGEMLGWCDEWVRQVAWGESYFDPQEVQTDAARYYRLVTALRERWGEEVVSLFERAWHCQSLADCPTFGEWLLALPDLPVEAKTPGKGAEIPLATAPLLAQAQSQEDSGNLAGAIATYEQIVEQVASTSGIAEEIRLILPQMREKLARQTQLAHRVDEAREHEANERWQSAAAHYEGLLGETDLSPEQRATWEADLGRCQTEVTLAGLFDAAMVAMAQDRWVEARAGLRDLTQRRPGGYTRNGVSAQSVLDSAEKHLAPKVWRPRRAALFGGTGLLVVVVIAALVILMNRRTSPLTVASGAAMATSETSPTLPSQPALLSGIVTATSTASSVSMVTETRPTEGPVTAAGTSADPPQVALTSTPGREWTILVGNRTALGYMNLPSGVALDGDGNLFVADTFNHRIQKFTPTGQPVAEWGTYGAGPGQIIFPRALVVDEGGNIYVADTGNHRIQKFSSDGKPLEQWGHAGSEPGTFNRPSGLALDAARNIYVADTDNNRIQKLSSSGQPIAQWGGKGSDPGQFDHPSGVAVDLSGNLYVTDTGNGRVQKLSPNGAPLAQWGKKGNGAADFQEPSGIAIDATGNLYVVDRLNHRIQKLSATGQTLGQWGEAGGGPGQLQFPVGVSLDRTGNIYVANSYNHRVDKFNTLGTPIVQFGLDVRAAGQLDQPIGVATDVQGDVYVVELGNNRVQHFSKDGKLVTQLGGFGADPGHFVAPSGITVDKKGNVYVTEWGTHRLQKFSIAGVELAHWGAQGSKPGEFSAPSGVAVDDDGNIYVADHNNNRIQKLSPTGDSIAIWGTEGDGPGQFNHPARIALDRFGNIYVADVDNNRIQKLSPSGQPLAQWGTKGSGPGQFGRPSGIAVDLAGNVYVADTNNNRIQELSPTGQFVEQWGGQGTEPGKFQAPQGIVLDANGNLYVADLENSRVQKLSFVKQP